MISDFEKNINADVGVIGDRNLCNIIAFSINKSKAFIDTHAFNGSCELIVSKIYFRIEMS